MGGKLKLAATDAQQRPGFQSKVDATPRRRVVAGHVGVGVWFFGDGKCGGGAAITLARRGRRVHPAGLDYSRMTGQAPRILPKWRRSAGNSAEAGSGVTGVPVAFR